MISSKRIAAVSLPVGAVLACATATVAQTCEPVPGAFECAPWVCSTTGDDHCLVIAAQIDPATGALTAAECECVTYNGCHMILSSGLPRTSGVCPADLSCDLFAWDTNGDGIEDRLTAECAGDIGACCVDIDDGPVAYDTCIESNESSCHANGGLFHPTNVACDAIEACCLAFAGDAHCVQMSPFCCAASGGVPQGPDSTCANTDPNMCPRICGGLAGLPCGEGEFCDFPVGTCEIADRQGICRPLPGECPTLWDPVCGCDGVTYANECVAHISGMPIRHWGGCERFCFPEDTSIPCGEGEFCKAPEGDCFSSNDPGVCTTIPTGCPDVWEPVCGCNGVTYGNECDADASMVSIRHRGPCETDCRPTDDGFGCMPAHCSDIPEDMCMPSVLHIDWSTGAITAVACECIDFNFCHIEFGDASPFAVGYCPGGGTCEVVGIDTDNDGIDDQFWARCAGTGACCYDVGGSPLPVPACYDTTADECKPGMGMFAGVGTTCERTEACCLTHTNEPACTDIAPHCCSMFGGVPQGPGSSCADATTECGEICGGIAWIPCENPEEFCKLPQGGCCCDFLGVCTPFPLGCPDVWDPVCGCDGVTYANECEADAVGVSTDHYGECGIVCRPADDGFGCTPLACSMIPEEQCLITAIGSNGTTNSLATIACECMDFNLCHIEYVFGGPVETVGYCPNGGTCELVGHDVNGDGVDDHFTAECVSTGACCFDMGGSPFPVPVCVEMTREECRAQYGFFAGPDATCEMVAACCLGPGGEGVCVDAHPVCCLAFGGIPQGPGSSCETHDCWRECGGIAGIPCGEGEFCMYPPGTCHVADRQGVCQPIPEDCPRLWDPVCGCDGVTYPNECEAHAADMSIDYPGECMTGACCMPPTSGMPPCFIGSREACRLAGGAYQGEGTTCPPDPTMPCGPPIGACCLPSGTAPTALCDMMTAEECFDRDGDYQGDWTTCPGPNEPCGAPTGACCLRGPDGEFMCVVTTEERCLGEGGTHVGIGTTCPADPAELCAPLFRACCMPDGRCYEVPEEYCLAIGGKPVPGASCDEILCGPPLPGACCLADPAGTVSCLEVLEEDCLNMGGDFQGPGTTCDDPDIACGSACQPPCPPDEWCFSGCGTLVQGAVCILFETPSGDLYLLDTLGDFTVGDVVDVTGCVSPSCLSICAEGHKCMTVNSMEPCDEVCGGIAGIPCRDPNEFCKFPLGTCGEFDLFGVCTVMPGGCPDVWDPVCGCDGNTYGNECEADAVGVSILHWGECEVRHCWSHEMCEPDEYCFLDACLAETGTCVRRPTACPDVWDPVCGCNGVTYPNACEAARARISVDYPGICEELYCWSNDMCPPDQYCFFHVCEVETGMCMPRPTDCPDVWDPVCGCDGVTYPNACEAARAGMSVDHHGECERVCGGLGPYPPCSSDEFCKFPVGVCDDLTVPGMCTVIPEACPEYYDPVCGCDGRTYDNECFADSASVSIDYFGACEVPACAATRSLANPDLSYCSGAPKYVQIHLSPQPGATSYALEDSPPAGWAVTEIGGGGTYDPVNGKVKWGPFFAPDLPRSVGYVVIPTNDAGGVACFTGTISIDGINEPICGDDCIESSCCPHMEADRPQPACPMCPIGDCTTCPNGRCQDGRISMCELIGYACAWLLGCNDDLAGMTRAAFIWRNGECYCWDEAEANWFPSSCPSSAPWCCESGGVGIAQATGIGTATVTLPSARPTRSSRTEQVKVPITIEPPAGATAVALELVVPRGWKVTGVSDGGAWDELNRKVKWGPFTEDLARTVTFKASQRVFERSSKGESTVSKTLSGRFFGTVSFDGVNQPVSIE